MNAFRRKSGFSRSRRESGKVKAASSKQGIHFKGQPIAQIDAHSRLKTNVVDRHAESCLLGADFS